MSLVARKATIGAFVFTIMVSSEMKEDGKMIGAIMGDMIGAPYEFDRSPKTKEFPLFSNRSEFTDDSVMTVL